MVGTALIAVLLVGLSAALVVRAISLPRARTVRSLDQIRAYGFVTADTSDEPEQTRMSPVELLGSVIASRLGRKRLAMIRRKLINAGLHNTSAERFLGLYLMSAIGLPLLMLWVAVSTQPKPAVVALIIGNGLYMGVLMPMMVVSRRARMRLERIDYEVPELVDLLVVGVESGMGFNGAARVATSHVEGPLGEELRLMLQQQSLGASTTEALQNLLDRNDTPAVHSFVRAIVQGERLGVSIGHMMRSLAEEMRKRRKALAEEKAHKTPIKIIFPLVLLLLPAMFIVLLMPVVVNIGNALSGF